MTINRLDTKQGKEMVLYISKRMQESKETLSHADQIIGDGDHGIGMARGFESVEVKVSEKSFLDFEELFKLVGMTLLSTIGGAAGAVFGSLFLGMSKKFSGTEYLDSDNFTLALHSGLEMVQKRGNAKVGDKTMIDALSPAVDIADRVKGKPLDIFFNDLWQAAYEGKEKTKDMVSRIGKSKTQGERSLGYPDPGAISMTLIFKFMNEFVTTINE